MRSVPIPLGIMAYQSASLQWNAQRLVNWFPETAPDPANPKSQILLRPRPGLTQETAISGMCRGQQTMAGVLYAVYGQTLYSIPQGGSATALGTITGSGPVSMANNGIQLCIVDDPDAWVYDNSNSTFQQITDADFPGSKYVAYSAGFFVHVVPGNSGEFFVSNLNDALNYDALDFATAETSGDPLLAVFSTHGELWLFGTESIEPWGANGSTLFPFSPIQSAKLERGCSAPFSITNYDNTVVWIGDDRIVYRGNGYQPVRISTHAVEKRLSQAGDLSSVQGGWFTIAGHTFYIMKYPGLWSFVYDAATNFWHEWGTFSAEYWAYGYPVNTYGGVLVGGDNGNLYRMSLEAATDAGTTIAFETTSPEIHANTARLNFSRFQLDMEVGSGLNDGQGSNPQAMLSWSKDGGLTWSSEHWRSFGRIGEYRRRVIWRRLGQAFQIVFKIRVTDPVRPALYAAYADTDTTPA